MLRRIRGSQLLLLPLLIMTSCRTMNKQPKDYELNKEITNVNGGVYYEIFVRSFADSNKDGIGDLKGIEQKLDYLEDLGVKGLWLTPIHPSPSYHGYDVVDYKDIKTDYGTLEDFDSLVSKAKEKNIDIIIDLVLNHTALSHPWFIEGKQNFTNGGVDLNDVNNKANWYDFYTENGVVKFKEGVFGGSMPELRLDNTAIRQEIISIVQFWMDRGIKGFRLDATSHYYSNDSKNIEFLSWFNDVVKQEREDAYIVGEAWINYFERQKLYYQGIDSFFNFEGADVSGYIVDKITGRNGNSIGFNLEKNYDALYEINENAIMAMFLTNHDMDRSSMMFMFDLEKRQKLAASLYLMTPGYPFMYYGEEIAIKGNRMNNQTDANRRLPMLWQKTDDTMRPSLPPLTDYPMTNQVKDGVKEQLETPFSLLNHYKKVINVRNSYPWLTHARLDNVTLGTNNVTSLKLISKDGNELIHVIHNITSESVVVDLDKIPEYELVIKHDIFSVEERAKLEAKKLTLAPYSSVILERKA